ncbi:MAG: hypothetical protein Kapaf2KO_07390 [Candidatus Kapaibacteriales bacterium]
MRKIIPILLTLLVLLSSCGDDTPGPDNNSSGKLLKSVEFNTDEFMGPYSRMSFEYDSQSRLSKAIYGINVTDENDQVLVYEIMYDNFIYENGEIKTIDFYNSFDSSSYKINYRFAENRMSVGNSDRVGTEYKFALNIEYEGNLMVKSQLNETTPTDSTILNRTNTELTYISDSIVRTVLTYNDQDYIFFYKVDNSIKLPFNKSNVLIPSEFNGDSRLLFLGSDIIVSGIASSLEKALDNDFYFEASYGVDNDIEIIEAIVRSNENPDLKRYYNFEYY